LSAIKAYLKYAGAVEILLGAVLCFYGLAILAKSLTAMCFLGVYMVIFLTGNVFVTPTKMTVIIFAVLGLIGASIVAFLFYRVVHTWGATILLAGCGFMIGLMLIAPLSKLMPRWICFLLLAGLTLVAAFFGKAFDKQVKAYGTAIVGSGFLVHGAGQFIGGFPSLSDTKVKLDWGYLGYLVAFAGLAAAGAYVQDNYIKKEESDVFFKDGE